VRLRGRAGHHQPPRRPRYAAADQHRQEGLRQGRLLRQDPRRGGQGDQGGAERAHQHPDVTERVNAAVTADMPADKAMAARRGIMAKIEEEALGKQDPKKFRYDVVTLYQGGEYHLYGYHKYTDVRLVFAPEQQIAFYGGDPDNFEYPRYDLDICIFRVYED